MHGMAYTIIGLSGKLLHTKLEGIVDNKVKEEKVLGCVYFDVLALGLIELNWKGKCKSRLGPAIPVLFYVFSKLKLLSG
jgi:hypothetical protein